MKTLIYLNTLANIFIIGYWLYKNNRLYLKWSRTTWDKKLLGVNFMWKDNPSKKSFRAKGLLYIPLRFNQRLEINEEAIRLSKKPYQVKLQRLTAKFSWLKTIDEVVQFEKDYKSVDEVIVSKLVNDFFFKNNNNKK